MAEPGLGCEPCSSQGPVAERTALQTTFTTFSTNSKSNSFDERSQLTETLKDVKRRLSARFLGRSGIHGFGINRAAGSVRVYVDLDKDSLPDDLLSELRKHAGGHAIEVIPQARASFH